MQAPARAFSARSPRDGTAMAGAVPAPVPAAGAGGGGAGDGGAGAAPVTAEPFAAASHTADQRRVAAVARRARPVAPFVVNC